MSDQIKKDGASLPEAEAPKDEHLFTPQGGGGGTGSSPLSAPAPKVPVEKSVTLPQVGPEEAEVSPDAGAPEEEEGASSFRLLMTLGVAGAIAGALLVFVYLWSQPLIEAENARILQEAVTEVLKSPDHFESIFIDDGELVTVAQVSAGVDTMELDKVFLGYDASGEPVGFAMTHRGFGFQDLITVIFGYDPEARQVIGMKVLGHSETPGLGNKIEDQPFVGEFDGAQAPLEGVKPDRNTGQPNQVDMITGVTISSKAVVKIINERIAELGDLLAGYEPTGGVQEEGQ
jgi:electron transport complex protein RnfG